MSSGVKRMFSKRANRKIIRFKWSFLVRRNISRSLSFIPILLIIDYRADHIAENRLRRTLRRGKANGDSYL